MSRVVQWGVALLGAGLVLATLLWSLWPDPPPPGALLITQASFAKSESITPPDDGHPWGRRPLPDDWRQSNPGQHGYGWYRAKFKLDAAPTDSWGVYLSHVSSTYQAFINGTEIGTGGGMTGVIRRMGSKPQFDLVPRHLLRAGENELLLLLRVGTNLRGGLGPVTLGPREVVEDLYDRAFFARVTLPRSINLALMFAGLLVLLLWLRRPQESLHGFFGGLAVLWSVRNFHYTVSFSFIPSLLWEVFVLGSLGVVLLLLFGFILRLSGQHALPLERRLACAVLAAPLLFLALGEQLLSQIRIAWYLACAGLGLLSVTTLLRYLRTPHGRRRSGTWVILAAMIVTLLLGLSDLAVSAGLVPFGPSARMAFGAPLLLTALVYAVAENYFKTFDDARMLNIELEQRVVERTQALEQAHVCMVTFERTAAIAQERDRLMRDMHDGVGSQLMTTLYALERGDCGTQEVVARLREGIADLRLVIDSMESGDHSLNLALANLRYRQESQLNAVGIQQQWLLDEVVGPAMPNTVLQVLRIVQEAVANVVRHSGASQLRVSLFEQNQTLVLEVADNGCARSADTGAPVPAQARHGLRNMHMRARQIGAHLALHASANGTVVILQLPMPPAEA